MKRRPLPLLLSLMCGLGCLWCQTNTTTPYLMTVTGELPTKNLGALLPHEHAIADFLGAEVAPQPRYGREAALQTILPHLKNLKEAGYDVLFECTPNYLGRDVALLKELSELSGVHIVTNTGYYSAVDKKFLPKHAFTDTMEALAQRWEAEWENGIGDSGIRPGFIKLGVGKGPLDAMEEKLLRAALRVHKKTGLTLAMHTGDGAAAMSEYGIVMEEGVGAENMIWVHAQNGTDAERANLASKGVWISLDGVHFDRLKDYVAMLQYLKERDLLSRVLISHDYFWNVVEKDGDILLLPYDEGKNVPYQTIAQHLLPKLRELHFSEKEIELMIRENPMKAYALKK